MAIRQRTALCNLIRGLLYERGIIINKGISSVRKKLAEYQSDAKALNVRMKLILAELYDQLTLLDSMVLSYNQQIEHNARDNDICQKLTSIPGIGAVIATAFFNEVGNGSAYRKGRDVSASLGLVPRQHTTGGKEKLLGISKKGNAYLRCLMIQGAKSVVSRASTKTDKLSLWLNRLVAERGHNRTCVAYANKMARMAWAITVSGEEYKVV